MPARARIEFASRTCAIVATVILAFACFLKPQFVWTVSVETQAVNRHFIVLLPHEWRRHPDRHAIEKRLPLDERIKDALDLRWPIAAGCVMLIGVSVFLARFERRLKARGHLP